MAQQGWPPQSPATTNAGPYNPNSFNANPYNTAPQNPALAANGGQPFGNPPGNLPSGVGPTPMPTSNGTPNGWSPPDLTPPNNPSSIAQTAAINDPNVPEPTRRLREEMENVRLKAVSERQSRDNAVRQRAEMLKRQLRDEELSRANIVNPVYSQPTSANRGNGLSNSTASNPGGPIVIGPPPNSNVPNSGQWQSPPDAQSPPNSVAGQSAYGAPQGLSNQVPNSIPERMPNSGLGSPLDSMPTWPLSGSLPPITSNYPSTGPNSTNSGPNQNLRPNGYGPGVADDPARIASRMGMNAGPGNPFQITPGPSSGATNAPNTVNNFGPFNGVSPTTPPNWPANPNGSNDGTSTGEPPDGTFGSRIPLDEQGIMTTVNPQQDQLPPSTWYQTPGRFGDSSTGTTQTQPASYGTGRYAGTIAPSDRFRGNERMNNGPIAGTQNAQTSTPSMQNALSTPLGENSLNDYERMIQMQNAETNQLRQQLDDQRQLPPSENFRSSSSSSSSSRTAAQTSTPNGTYPRR